MARYTNKRTTKAVNALDVRKFQRDGLLKPGTRFNSTWSRNGRANGSISVSVNTGSVNLIYRHGGDTGQDMNYPVRIERTPCNYGGQRVCGIAGGRLWAARGGVVWRQGVCVQALPQTSVPYPAGATPRLGRQ